MDPTELFTDLVSARDSPAKCFSLNYTLFSLKYDLIVSGILLEMWPKKILLKSKAKYSKHNILAGGGISSFITFIYSTSLVLNKNFL